MTRQPTVNALRTRPRGSPTLNRLPKEGTQLRRFYDRLLSNAGIGIPLTKKEHVYITVLTDYYGCDIRWSSRGCYMLCGEIVDGKYVDYFAKRYERKIVMLYQNG